MTDKLTTYDVTNHSAHPRNIFAGERWHHIGRGETKPLAMTEAQLQNAYAEGVAIKRAAEDQSQATADPSQQREPDEFDTMSDDDLRAHIELHGGEKPHHRAGRASLLERARALPAEPKL